jgi:hypothetical protein
MSLAYPNGKQATMKNNSLTILLLLCIILPATVYVLMPDSMQRMMPQSQPLAEIQYQQPRPRIMEPGAEFGIQSVRVLNDHTFYLILDNGMSIEAKLSVIPRAEAAPEIVDIFQSSTNPSAILLRKMGNSWVVRINLDIGNRRSILINLLQEQNLLL